MNVIFIVLLVTIAIIFLIGVCLIWLVSQGFKSKDDFDTLKKNREKVQW